MADNPLIHQAGQSGDQTYRDAAGRDITHVGMDPAQALSFVRDYLFKADQERERADQEQARRLDRLADALELHEISERQRRVVDDAERTAHRAKLDRDLEALRKEQRALHAAQLAFQREQRRTRRVLFWFGVGILVALAVAGALVWDRYTALALLRVWAGGGAAVAWALWRGGGR